MRARECIKLWIVGKVRVDLCRQLTLADALAAERVQPEVGAVMRLRDEIERRVVGSFPSWITRLAPRRSYTPLG